MRRARRAALLVLLASCARDRVFECEEDEQCQLGGTSGRCEPSGYCSLPDPDCPDGFRYVEQAPDSLAGTCVGVTGCDQEPCDGCAVAVAAGARHSCALDQMGDVYCWGDNADLQLGSAGESSAEPRRVAGVTDAVAVAAGDRHSCAVLSEDRGVICWGANDSGQHGTGTTGASALPDAPVFESESARSLSASGGHSCAIDDEETAWCWGDNQFRQVAPGGSDSAPYPQDPLGLFDSAISVAAGGRHSAAVLDYGGVITWGEASAPALGRGDPAPSDPFEIVLDAFEGASITAGAEHTCGIGADQQVRCWGAAGDGRLGVDGGDRDSPVQVSGLSADLVRAGGRHTCALRGADLVCWGANDAGQLGADGPSGSERRQVTGSWRDVATGAAHTCAVSSAAVVHCFGDNAAGQLGSSGSSSSEPTPVALPCP